MVSNKYVAIPSFIQGISTGDRAGASVALEKGVAIPSFIQGISTVKGRT